MTPPAFTAEQRAAIADRGGSRLLAANAGSGKTAVLVERFVEAVLLDEVPVSAILALTFTEKAAAELRERTRRRFLELGAAEAARATDGAWIGTIHGFCARVLRAAPLAAGLDPRFRVLAEPEADRLARRAYESALDGWVREEGEPALELVAAYGTGLRELVLGAHATLRSRGQRRPALPLPSAGPAPDPAALAAARAAAAAHLGAAGSGRRVADGLLALERCAVLLGGAGAAIPVPAVLAPAELGRGARALGEEPADRYREAWGAYRAGCADHHAWLALRLLDGLLSAFADSYAAEKLARAGLDFDDLELGVRDLLAGDPGLRRRWAERFALVMVDEFQDTNRLQLDLLEALERDDLFAVGDELQSIYGFRHADVEIFRARRAALGPARVRRLRTNFRSAPELLRVLNGAFAPVFGPAFAPLEPGRREPEPAPSAGELRLFDPDPGAAQAPRVELLLTDARGWDDPELAARVGLAAPGVPAARRAEARLVAQELREEVRTGRAPGDIVVLVRATSSLRLFEAALEEQGLPTFVVGGRGYWSSEQVRDGLAYLAALANPRDERALYAVLASPLCGVGSDALVSLAQAGRASGAGAWGALRAAAGAPGRLRPAGPGAVGAAAGAAPGAEEHATAPRAAAEEHAAAPLAGLPAAERVRLLRFAAFFAAERERAEREPVEALLERAIVATGYDLAVLRRRGGERRLANLRKLMRLAREHERTEGRDLRAFLAWAQGQDLAQAREGDAALEAEGLAAIRLMTIHRAKGLEFPVVCIPDLGRGSQAAAPPLLLGEDGRVGLRLRTLGSGESVPALDHEALAAEAAAAEGEEEQRLVYVAATRARERLVLSGTLDGARPPAGVARPGGAPLGWLAPALLDEPGRAFDPETPVRDQVRTWEGRPARLRIRLNAPATLGVVLREEGLAPARPPAAVAAPATPAPPHLPLAASPAVPAPAPPATAPGAPVPTRLSYSSLHDHERCGYRFYLRRVLGLPPVDPPGGSGPASQAPARGLDPRERGILAHLLLERLDPKRPAVPAHSAVLALAAAHGLRAGEADAREARAAFAAFVASPVRERLARATRVLREAPFAFALDPEGGGALLTGAMDAVARERDGTTLVVDYKTDRLEGEDAAAVVQREYEIQRLTYALAALRDGAARVEVAHVFLERPAAPVLAAFTAADAPGLARELRARAGDLLAGRYPVTPHPHRELCGDCPGRAALCSWPEGRTLRERRPAASAA